jgi:hypothetical protein
MNYAHLWERLLAFLMGWSTVREVSDGIEVTFESPTGASRTVKVMMTREDWDEFVTVPFGDFSVAASVLMSSIVSLPAEHPWLIYGDSYDFIPSASSTLSASSPASAGPGGEWVILDDEGTIVSRFKDWQEPEDLGN